MQDISGIASRLMEIRNMSSSGYALAFHIEGSAPRHLYQTYSKEWADYYQKNALHLRDPSVIWGLQNQGRIKWSDLSQEMENDVLQLAKNYGLNFGVSFSTKKGGTISIGSCARNDRDFSEFEIDELYSAFMSIHSSTQEAPILTDRQLSVLIEIAKGNTTEKAAEILEINLSTTRARLDRVREILGVRTQAEAVGRALELGLIDMNAKD